MKTFISIKTIVKQNAPIGSSFLTNNWKMKNKDCNIILEKNIENHIILEGDRARLRDFVSFICESSKRETIGHKSCGDKNKFNEFTLHISKIKNLG